MLSALGVSGRRVGFSYTGPPSGTAAVHFPTRPFSVQRRVSRQSRFLSRMRRVTTQAAFAEGLMVAEGQSAEALCVVSDALRLVFASHSLAFCSAAKRAASTGIPSIRIIVESSCKETREKCLGRLSLAPPCAPDHNLCRLRRTRESHLRGCPVRLAPEIPFTHKDASPCCQILFLKIKPGSFVRESIQPMSSASRSVTNMQPGL